MVFDRRRNGKAAADRDRWNAGSLFMRFEIRPVAPILDVELGAASEEEVKENEDDEDEEEGGGVG